MRVYARTRACLCACLSNCLCLSVSVRRPQCVNVSAAATHCRCRCRCRRHYLLSLETVIDVRNSECDVNAHSPFPCHARSKGAQCCKSEAWHHAGEVNGKPGTLAALPGNRVIGRSVNPSDGGEWRQLCPPTYPPTSTHLPTHRLIRMCSRTLA